MKMHQARIRFMAKIKAANRLQKLEKEQLTKLVAERTQALNQELLERKWAEAAAQDSYNAVKNILETTIDGYCLTDTQGHLLDVNKAYCQLSGYTREELLGMMISDVEAMESPAGATGHFQRITAHGSDTFESRHRRKDGSIWDVAVSVTFRDVAGGQFVAFLRDITERKAAEAALLERGQQLAVLSSASQRINAVLEIPVVMRYLVATAFELTGTTDGAAGLFHDGKLIFKEYNLAGKWMSIDLEFELGYGVPGWVMQNRAPYLSNDAEHDPHVIQDIQKALGFHNLVDVPIINRDGAFLGCFEIHNKSGGFTDTDIQMLQGLAASAASALENARLLADQQQATARIERLTHLYLTLAQANQAIVRAKDETQLFPEICRGAVLFGEMKMAWIGLADQAAQRVNPVASFGDDLHYLKDLQISLDEADPLGRGPTGTAIREGRPFWCQDFQNDPATAPWHERGARSGWRSSAVLPLRRKGVVVGALNFYSGIVNGFDEDARNLLIEMAADISHALDTFEDERERERIEAELHESERRYHTLVAWSPDAMAVHSGGILRYVNPAAIKLMGATSAQDLIGKPIIEVVHPDSQAIMLARVKEGLERGSEAPLIEERFIKLDGSVIDVEVKSTPITFDGVPALQVAVRDITERKRANEALRASLREKEALLKEVHHRVKNNLQVITSLLNLEAGRSAHPDTKAAFLEMQNRIRSMAMLHETLYRSDNLERVELPHYIKQLATLLFYSVAARSGAIQLHLDLAPASLALDQAVPCGLLINELVSNCLKHAFPDGRKGQVRVELQALEAGGSLKLRVSDNGVGLPPNFDAAHSTSLGLHLIATLTEQLNGQLEITPGPGTGAAFQVSFSPNQPSES